MQVLQYCTNSNIYLKERIHRHVTRLGGTSLLSKGNMRNEIKKPPKVSIPNVFIHLSSLLFSLLNYIETVVSTHGNLFSM